MLPLLPSLTVTPVTLTTLPVPTFLSANVNVPPLIVSPVNNPNWLVDADAVLVPS